LRGVSMRIPSPQLAFGSALRVNFEQEVTDHVGISKQLQK